MKLYLSSFIFLITLMTAAFAKSPSKTKEEDSSKFFVGIVGGGGYAHHMSGTQFGTLFYPEVLDGPRGINASGVLASQNIPFFSLFWGIQDPQRTLKGGASSWKRAFASEWEYCVINTRSFEGTFSDFSRTLPKYDIAVSYPISKGLLFGNSVMHFSNPSYLLHPYIGLGLGAASLRINNANSIALNSSGAVLKYYDLNCFDRYVTWAAQLKLGLSYNLTPRLSTFAEYRWLFLGDTRFVIGSNFYYKNNPYWSVTLGKQHHHLGTMGIRFTW